MGVSQLDATQARLTRTATWTVDSWNSTVSAHVGVGNDQTHPSGKRVQGSAQVTTCTAARGCRTTSLKTCWAPTTSLAGVPAPRTVCSGAAPSWTAGMPMVLRTCASMETRPTASKWRPGLSVSLPPRTDPLGCLLWLAKILRGGRTVGQAMLGFPLAALSFLCEACPLPMR